MIKLIHSSDWHLGKYLHAKALLEDQETALAELLEVLTSPASQPHALIIAGDVFDRSVPPEDAVEAMDRFLAKVAGELKIPVCLIPGNHDSNTRVGAHAELLRGAGLTVFSTPESVFSPVELEASGSRVAIYGIPYLEPAAWGFHFESEDVVRSHEQALHLILEKLEPQFKRHRQKGFRIVLVLHAFVAGAIATEESERRLSIGGSEMVPVELLRNFDYVALGHLHRPQSVGSERIRYSGSLLPYSQSEADQPKGFCEISLGERESEDTFAFRAFKKTRRLRVMRGELEDIITKAKANPSTDYVIAVLTDQAMPFEAFRRLHPHVPGLLHVGRISDWSREGAESAVSHERKVKRDLSDADVLGLFLDSASAHEVTDEDREWLLAMMEKFNKQDTTGAET